MQIERLPLTTLKPAPYNPRVALRPGDPGFEKLRRSLREFDLVQPIVWNRRTGHVVGGHQRVEVLRHEGHLETDCVVVDLPLAREKALNVALNNSNVGGRWEPARLVELVDDLLHDPELDATLTGFDDQQLRDLVLAPVMFEAEVDEESMEAGVVRVMLEVPVAVWPDVELRINAEIASIPGVRVHMKK
jgi:hypothetical protein